MLDICKNVRCVEILEKLVRIPKKLVAMGENERNLVGPNFMG